MGRPHQVLQTGWMIYAPIISITIRNMCCEIIVISKLSNYYIVIQRKITQCSLEKVFSELWVLPRPVDYNGHFHLGSGRSVNTLSLSCNKHVLYRGLYGASCNATDLLSAGLTRAWYKATVHALYMRMILSISCPYDWYGTLFSMSISSFAHAFLHLVYNILKKGQELDSVKIHSGKQQSKSFRYIEIPHHVLPASEGRACSFLRHFSVQRHRNHPSDVYAVIYIYKLSLTSVKTSLLRKVFKKIQATI